MFFHPFLILILLLLLLFVINIISISIVQDEYGTGESAGNTTEWGFVISETLIKDNSNNSNNNKNNNNGNNSNNNSNVSLPKDVNTDSDVDERLVLNHIDNGHGDRQSSRHGSRRNKVRSSSGTKRNNVSHFIFSYFYLFILLFINLLGWKCIRKFC